MGKISLVSQCSTEIAEYFRAKNGRKERKAMADLRAKSDRIIDEQIREIHLKIIDQILKGSRP